MNDLINILVAIAILYFGYKGLVLVWKHVIVPTGKVAWKLSIIGFTILFFMILFVFRNEIFDILPKPIQIIILLGLGFHVGVKYLKRKNRL